MLLNESSICSIEILIIILGNNLLPILLESSDTENSITQSICFNTNFVGS